MSGKSGERLSKAELRREFKKAVEQSLEETDFLTRKEAEEVVDEHLNEIQSNGNDEMPSEVEDKLTDEERERGEVDPERAGEILNKVTEFDKMIPVAPLVAGAAASSLADKGDESGAKDIDDVLTDQERDMGRVEPKRAGEVMNETSVGKAVPIAMLASAAAHGVREYSKSGDGSNTAPDETIADELKEQLPEDLWGAVRAHLADDGDKDAYLAGQGDELREKLAAQIDVQNRRQEAIAAELAEGEPETPVLDATVYDDE